MRSVRVVVTCLPSKEETEPCLQSTCKIRSDTYACVFRLGSLSVPSEKRPLYIDPTHLLAVTNRPLPCNVGSFGIPSSNKNGTIFRTGKPVPSSELLATNIASTGGAGVRRGEDGGDVFSLGTDSG